MLVFVTWLNKLSDIKVLTAKPSTVRTSCDYGKMTSYLEKVQQFPVEEHMMFGKTRAQSLLLKGSQNELSNDKAQGEAFPIYPLFINGNGTVKSNKLKIKETSDLKVNDWFFHSEYRAKPLQEKVGAISIENGARDMVALRCSRNYAKSEGTESDSSEQINEDENPFYEEQASLSPCGLAWFCHEIWSSA